MRCLQSLIHCIPISGIWTSILNNFMSKLRAPLIPAVIVTLFYSLVSYLIIPALVVAVIVPLHFLSLLHSSLLPFIPLDIPSMNHCNYKDHFLFSLFVRHPLTFSRSGRSVMSTVIPFPLSLILLLVEFVLFSITVRALICIPKHVSLAAATF